MNRNDLYFFSSFFTLMNYNIDLVVISKSKNKNKRLKKNPRLLKKIKQDDDVKMEINNKKKDLYRLCLKKKLGILYIYIYYTKKKRQILFSCFILYIHSCFCISIGSNGFYSLTKCFTINGLLGIEIIEWITYLR